MVWLQSPVWERRSPIKPLSAIAKKDEIKYVDRLNWDNSQILLNNEFLDLGDIIANISGSSSEYTKLLHRIIKIK